MVVVVNCGGGVVFSEVSLGVGIWARMGWDLVVVAGYPAFTMPKTLALCGFVLHGQWRDQIEGRLLFNCFTEEQCLSIRGVFVQLDGQCALLVLSRRREN